MNARAPACADPAAIDAAGVPRRPVQGAITLERSLDELSRLAPWLAALAAESGLPEETAFALDLFLQEAVGNIVMHGTGTGTGPVEIRVGFFAGEAGVSVTVADTLLPFDPTAVPLQPRPASLDEARPGGFGLRLISGLSGVPRYHHDGRHNVLTLVCPLSV
jgi:serine/threonine-protein kinase RsbW